MVTHWHLPPFNNYRMPSPRQTYIMFHFPSFPLFVSFYSFYLLDSLLIDQRAFEKRLSLLVYAYSHCPKRLMDRGGIRRVHSPFIIRDEVEYANIKSTGITYAEPKELLPPAVECAEYSGPLRMVTLNINLIHTRCMYICAPYGVHHILLFRLPLIINQTEIPDFLGPHL